jgi:hypothetical protein
MMPRVVLVMVCALALLRPRVARADDPPAASATPTEVPALRTPKAAASSTDGAEAQSEAPTAEAIKPADDDDAKKKQYAKWKNRPGGINPCMTPDPGYGIYDEWSRNISMGQLLAPQKGGLTPSGGFDLVVHFHGHYPIRKEFVKTAHGIVLVAIDLGIGSGAYSSAFASPARFEKLLESVKQEMARRSGRKQVTIRRLALSSWSAGYGAVQQILMQPAGKKVDAVILLDSLHAGYIDGSRQISPTGLDPFVDFARAAGRGQKLMFQSYSSIVPPGYASTREVAHYIVNKIGGRIGMAKRSDVLGLSMDERFDRGNYHVRGYLGDDKPDHCAHLGLMKDVVKTHLNRRWHSPRGSRDKALAASPPALRSKVGEKQAKAKMPTTAGASKRKTRAHKSQKLAAKSDR